jgi:phage tail tape-measure protein
MDGLTLALLGVGGYAVATQGERAVGNPSIATGSANTGKAMGTGSQLNLQKPLTIKTTTPKKVAAKFPTIKKMVFRPPTIGANGSSDPLSAYTREQIDAAKKLAKEQFDKLSCAAKQAGADVLNAKYNLDPPLGCNDSFEKVGAVVGAALGTAAGAACGPAAAVCAPIGAIVGAYLGKEFGVWLEANWDDIEKWAKGVIDDIGDAAEDALGSLKFW